MNAPVDSVSPGETHAIRALVREEILTTIDDPAYFTSQWSISRKFIWRPDRAIFAEYDCEDDVGRPDGVSRYGFSDAPGPGEN